MPADRRPPARRTDLSFLVNSEDVDPCTSAYKSRSTHSDSHSTHATHSRPSRSTSTPETYTPSFPVPPPPPSSKFQLRPVSDFSYDAGKAGTPTASTPAKPHYDPPPIGTGTPVSMRDPSPCSSYHSSPPPTAVRSPSPQSTASEPVHTYGPIQLQLDPQPNPHTHLHGYLYAQTPPAIVAFTSTTKSKRKPRPNPEKPGPTFSQIPTKTYTLEEERPHNKWDPDTYKIYCPWVINMEDGDEESGSAGGGASGVAGGSGSGGDEKVGEGSEGKPATGDQNGKKKEWKICGAFIGLRELTNHLKKEHYHETIEKLPPGFTMSSTPEPESAPLPKSNVPVSAVPGTLITPMPTRSPFLRTRKPKQGAACCVPLANGKRCPSIVKGARALRAHILRQGHVAIMAREFMPAKIAREAAGAGVEGCGSAGPSTSTPHPALQERPLITESTPGWNSPDDSGMWGPKEPLKKHACRYCDLEFSTCIGDPSDALRFHVRGHHREVGMF